MTDRNKLIEALYDAHIREIGGEVKSAEAMEAILPEVVDLIANDERDITSEGRSLIRSVITPIRSRRTSDLRKDLETILDGFTEDGPYIDPLLDRAYGMGRKTGIDKTLRLWTIDDFKRLVREHIKGGEEVVKAASVLAETIARVVAQMDAAGVGYIGDVPRGGHSPA